jgi:hypothetical protein
MVGAIAGGLGLLARLILWSIRPVLVAVGCGFALYGVWLFDPRVSYIAGGLAAAGLFWPRPKGAR